MNKLERLATLATMLAAGLVASWLLIRISADNRPPVQIQYAEALNAPIKQGEFLSVRIYRDKVRDDCTLTSDRFVINQVTGRLVEIPGRAWAGGDVNAAHVDLLYDVRKIPPGDYTAGSVVVYHCNRNKEFRVTSPLVPFRVLE